ncbi:MAG: oligoendopeptidase F [Bacilli bacterium]|nr:oligoendopeptidase F [Bacilli bacterium]
MKQRKREEVEEQNKWDLISLIKDEKELKKKSEKVEELLEEILKYKGRITESGKTLLKFLKTNDELSRLIDLLYVYVSLKLDEDSTNTKSQETKEKIEKLIEKVEERTTFIMPELLKEPYTKIQKYIEETKELEMYSFDLEKAFRRKEHILSEEKENILTKASINLNNSSNIYYYLNNTDIKLGNIENEKGETVELTSSNYRIYIENKNREIRKNAFEKLHTFWKEHKNTVTAIYKAKLGEVEFNRDIRKYKTSIEMYLYSDKITVDVYDNLIEKVHNNLDKMYEYQELRKKLLKVEEMHMYDIYAPIIEIPEKTYTFEETQDIIKNALKPLGETYVTDLTKAFTNNWIDIYPNIGKKSGAYQWGCYDSEPRVLLNFMGTFGDVSTTAHELGHAMHSYYSNKNQEYVYSSYPIFLAEIASTVNEVLLNDYMYKKANTKEEKSYYLNELIDLIKSTVFRQTMFAEFESIMHKKYQKQEPITEKEISDTYYGLNKLYFGNNVISDELIKYEWERIPHFYTPFYVYKYATGLSSAVCIAYNILNKKEKALEKYLEFLKSGCIKYPLETLKDAGVDLISGYPVEETLKIFGEKVNELKKLMEE